jgi:hypothetical protein
VTTGAPTSKLTAMQGSGFYNRNATVQASGMEGILRVWEQVATSVPVGDEPLVVADYAASQGKNEVRVFASRSRRGGSVGLDASWR